MKKILILGGSGYIGSVLSLNLLKEGFKVIVIDNLAYENSFSLIPLLGDKNFQFIQGDFYNEKILKKNSVDIEHVIVLAGLVGDPITKKYPKTSNFINNIGVKKCFDFFDNMPIKRLIFISTCSNYGLIPQGELADEDYELNPLSLYAKAKVDNESYLMSKKNKVKYSATILRFATAFGLSPRMRFDLTISEFTRDLFFGKTLKVFDEFTWRPYCHVRDFSRLINLVLKSEPKKTHFKIFNAGGDQNNATKKMITDLIKSKLKNVNIEFSKKDSDPRNYKVDFNKVKTELGFTPLYTIEDGIDELIEAFKIGIFKDCFENKLIYGNYIINNSRD